MWCVANLRLDWISNWRFIDFNMVFFYSIFIHRTFFFLIELFSSYVKRREGSSGRSFHWLLSPEALLGTMLRSTFAWVSRLRNHLCFYFWLYFCLPLLRVCYAVIKGHTVCHTADNKHLHSCSIQFKCYYDNDRLWSKFLLHQRNQSRRRFTSTLKYVGTVNIYQYLKYGIIHLARLDMEKAWSIILHGWSILLS